MRITPEFGPKHRVATAAASADGTIRAPTPGDYAELVLVSAIWGSSFLCIAIALRDLSPLQIASGRILLATLVIFVLLALRGERLPRDRRSLGLFLAIGALNGAVPFTLIGWGQLGVGSATTGVLLAASPFATLLFSHFMTRDDRFTPRKFAGLMLGFCGVLVLLLGGAGADTGGDSVPGMLAIVLAACCYALSALFVRRLAGLSSLAIVAGSLGMASALMLVSLVAFHPPWQGFSGGWVPGAALVFLALGPTAFCYVMRTRIVQRNGAVFMSGVGYLIPLFAVFWGWLFAGERPTSRVALALLLILGGIAVGQWRSRRRAAPGSPDARIL